MESQILTYLLFLVGTLVLPVSIWVRATWRLSRIYSLTEQNYQERVQAILGEEILSKMSQLLEELFPQYGRTPPSRSAPFPMVIQQLVAYIPEPDRLNHLSEMYRSLAENGLQSQVFLDVVQKVLSILSGGG